LSFLAEQFGDLLAYKPPKEYKPAKASEAAIRDRNYSLERLEHLSHSLTTFLHSPKTPSLLTAPELTYFTIVSLLAASLLTCLSTARSDPAPKSLSHVTSTIRTSLSSLRASCLHPSPRYMTPMCFSLTDMHTTSYLRDTALVIKHSASFVLGFHERELARDRSGKAALHRDVVAEMKALEVVAGKTLSETKAHIQKLKEALGEGGWLDRMLDWTFGDDVDSNDPQEKYRQAVSDIIGGPAAAEEWAGKVLESWRDTVKGWLMVRWE